MRMLLTSNGVTNDAIRDALVDLLGKPVSASRIVAVIDAMLPFPGDKTTMLANVEAFRALGWAELDVLTLFSGPPSGIEKRLRSTDVIFAYGGTNHWLAHAWLASGLAPVLEELLAEKVYVGLSAGSMIFSRQHAAVVVAFDDQEEVDMLELDSVAPALPLFDWVLMPHLGASFFPHATDDWAAEHAARLGTPVWYLDDRSALVVRDVGAAPVIVSDGHWLHFGDGGVLLDSR